MDCIRFKLIRLGAAASILGALAVSAEAASGQTNTTPGDTLVGWGACGSFGQSMCDLPLPRTGFTSVAVGLEHCLAIKADSSIVAWGGENALGELDVPLPNTSFIMVSAGYYFGLGLRADGSVVAWGDNSYGQCNVPEPNQGFVAIAAGQWHSLGLKEDSSVVAWGYNEYGQCSVPLPNTDFIAIAAGRYHSLGLRENGSIEAWGTNYYGQCAVPPPNSDFSAVAGGWGHSIGLKNDGSVTAWGCNDSGQCEVPSPNEHFVAVSAGYAHSLGLKLTGSVIRWGNDCSGECTPPLPNVGFVAISAGGFYSLGVKVPCLPIALADVPGDEGGSLIISWPRHAMDSLGAWLPATSYDIQRRRIQWETITTVQALQADSYSAVVGTADILVIGEPEPYTTYRVVTKTTHSGVFYESLPDSGYSIDNLPPDPPELSLYDSETYRSLSWVNPSAPDLSSSCLYRGTEPGFEAGDPLLCSPTQYWYQETDLNRYWYRARSFDIHGNASEWSNEVVGRYPTAVPGVPTVLRLYPNQPNPFNPSTTLRFDLPVAGSARLAVYDIAGRLVRVLVDGELPAGSHEASWDGRDSGGRGMASGSYFARLTANGRVETVRMGLVR